jgi:hypothetical protein
VWMTMYSVLSGVPAASMYSAAWARGTGHCIRLHRTKRPLGRAAGGGKVSGTPQIPLGGGLRGAAGDALISY